MYDWGRPQTETRRLHIDKSIAVTRHDLAAPIIPAPPSGDGTRHTLTHCEYFTLELISASMQTVELDTQNETFHALTVIEGRAELVSANEIMTLEKFQTALVPACLGKYQLHPLEEAFRVLKSSV